MAGTLRQMIVKRRSSGVNEYVTAMKNVNLENVSENNIPLFKLNYLKVPSVIII
jgi:hypothetical protein